MDFLFKWIEKNFSGPLTKSTEEKHIVAIREGITGVLPLILIGSSFLILANPPFEFIANAIAPLSNKIVLPYQITIGLISIYMVYGMGTSLAKSYDINGKLGGLLSLTTFLLLSFPENTDILFKNNEENIILLSFDSLGGKGIFLAIFSMVFTIEMLRLFKRSRIKITLPNQVPSAVAQSINTLIPGLSIVFIVWLIKFILKIDISYLINLILLPLNNLLGNTLIGVLVPVILITVLWSAGIHGASIIGTMARPFWLLMLGANGQAVIAGSAPNALPYIAPEQFYQWLVWIGGSGATLSLSVLLLFTKSTHLKKLGKVSIIPSIFNINEPLIFGLPIMLNPILAIPFILAPTVTTSISYFFVKNGLVNGFTNMVPWTFPAPLGAFLSSNNDWKVILLVGINMIIAGIIYYPFIKIYDRKLVLEEKFA